MAAKVAERTPLAPNVAPEASLLQLVNPDFVAFSVLTGQRETNQCNGCPVGKVASHFSIDQADGSTYIQACHTCNIDRCQIRDIGGDLLQMIQSQLPEVA